MHKYSVQSEVLLLSGFGGETLEVEEKNNLLVVAVQFHIISEHGAPPLAQPVLSRCLVTEGNTFSPGCAILSSIIASTGFFSSLSTWDEHVGLSYRTVDGTSNFFEEGQKYVKEVLACKMLLPVAVLAQADLNES